MTKKTDIQGMDLSDLKAFVESIGERPYRAAQLFYWLYNRGVSDFAAMTDIPMQLRSRLSETAFIGTIEPVRTRVSKSDGTAKILFKLSDGLTVESVLIPPGMKSNGEEGNRLTLCVSTQVGCPLGCVFCATGSMGFLRNLTSGEIAGQIFGARRMTRRKITNLVFMGMGEPMLNYENVMKSIDILSNENSVGISVKRTTVSTAGYVASIRRMADEGRKCKLAISLHSVDDAVRSKLMPITKKHPVAEILEAAQYYYRKTRRRITFEYILFRGINDTDKDATGLIRFARSVPSKINLIPFHSIDFMHPHGFGMELRPSTAARTEKFAQTLREANITVMVRSSAGEDIEAACGQLAVAESSKDLLSSPIDEYISL